MIRLELPWPPSMNHYWRNVAGRTLISKEGRDYRTAVQWQATAEGWKQPFPAGQRVSVRINAVPPDKRRRDLDNMLKPMLDALTHAGLWADDSQIDELFIRRHPARAGGLMIVEVS